MSTPFLERAKQVVFGAARDPLSPTVFHKLSLIALFAWIGLGADGLSSACYGPQEAYAALGAHRYLSIIVALATVVTIFLISASYMQVVEMFPTGGGGYLAASKLLSPGWGVLSGCALLVDFVLTIAISIASGADALFSFVPPDWQRYKLGFAVAGVCVLVLLNLRGVRESVVPLVPVFIAFLVTHMVLIGWTVWVRSEALSGVAHGVASDWASARSELGLLGALILILRAYGMGAGTYTGIEAVSCGIPVLREPKIQTAKRTTLYMAVSLAFAAFGLMLAYLLYGIEHVPGKTFNALVCENVVAGWPGRWGTIFLAVTLFSEGALLFVAAQTGFFGGPNILATMAKDRWVPARFALLSNRLVVQNGILLIGGAALLTLLLTQGSVSLLVVLYSINVFIGFTLSQLGIFRHWCTVKADWRLRAKRLAVCGAGLTLTVAILLCVVVLKFFEGGWITLACTGGLLLVVHGIRREYTGTYAALKRLDDLVPVAEQSLGTGAPRDPAKPLPKTVRTAVLFVNGYNGVGIHSLLAIFRLFGDTFGRFVFVQIGVIDHASFKGVDEIQSLKAHTASDVKRYVTLLEQRGFAAESISVTGLDVAEEAGRMSPELNARYGRCVFFGGQLVFKRETLVTRLLHNYTIFDIQRRLYQLGIQFVILPIRV